jgi:glutamate/tyrosine decarboxylase-like PLP-dependent enzyme
MEAGRSPRELLGAAAQHASDFLDGLDGRPVFPSIGVDELRERLGGPLPEGSTDPQVVLDELVAAADPGLVAMAGGRYFGFVIGGSVHAALAADWLTSAWDQNAGLYVGGPSAAVVEEVAGAWLAELFGLPAGVSFAFVTGCQMAHVTALAAARQHILAQHGWDVSQDGLTGAPAIRVVAADERHVTVDRALRLLGLGNASIVPVPSDGQGRMRVGPLREALDELTGPTIVCAQLGNVNTGSFDPLDEIADAAEQAGAWLHVDGAFGLWAATVPALQDLVKGVDRADSWATDAHKWLNVPYDSGIAFCRHPEAHRAAMTVTAAYLIPTEDGAGRDQVDWTPEFSRRARGFAVYAALRSLGRSGVAELVERCCAHARRFAGELGADPGVEILNDVVLNQVLVRFLAEDGSHDVLTDAVVARVQAGGELWLGGTTWHGMRAMRISVSNWLTSDDDVSSSVEAILRAAALSRD